MVRIVGYKLFDYVFVDDSLLTRYIGSCNDSAK